jgi:glycosyltransferase involved in cell wall biosynthesis
LFVGRLAANKAQHDIVKAFAAYRQFHDQRARLHLVGGGGDDPYGRTLRRFVEALGLQDAVTLTGGVSAAQLAAYYATADVFVVCSEHEGFCVPLLEAMHNRVPIVAYGATAVGETLARAGVVLPTKAPSVVAAAVARVVDDAALRGTLVDAGVERLGDFALERTRGKFWSAIEQVLS